MPKIERFEDIQAWQKARELVKEVYSVSNDGSFSKDFGLRDQIRRAAVSIMLNIAEGFARKTTREFSQFLVIAHGSAAEVQAALYVAIDQKYFITFSQASIGLNGCRATYIKTMIETHPLTILTRFEGIDFGVLSPL